MSSIRRMSSTCLLALALSPLVGPSLSATTAGSPALEASGQAEFRLTSIFVPPWLHEGSLRPIEFHFNEAVDFASVSANSIRIRDEHGTAAAGEFILVRDDVIAFRSSRPCDAHEGAGTTYRIEVPSQGTTGLTLWSQAGAPLAAGCSSTVHLPGNCEGQVVIEDDVVGPPQPVVRGAAGVSLTDPDATHLVIGVGDDAETRYFSFDENAQSFDALAEVPLNLPGQEDTAVAVHLFLNQAVDPSPENLSAGRVGIEYLDPHGHWRQIRVRVELVANCVGSRSLLRIEPIGSLPASTRMRLFLSPEFKDIGGDFNLLPLNNFGLMATRAPGG